MPLRKIESMDMSGTCFTNETDVNYNLPSGIKIFKIENCKNLRKINLTTISALEQFHGKGCRFHIFPIFNTTAPVNYIDMRLSDLQEMEFVDIAPFCQLKELKLEIKDHRGIQAEKRYCQCTKIQEWLKNNEIKYNPLNCTKPRSKHLVLLFCYHVEYS